MRSAAPPWRQLTFGTSGGIIPIIGSVNPDNIRDLAKAVDLALSREEWYHLLEAAMGQRFAVSLF